MGCEATCAGIVEQKFYHFKVECIPPFRIVPRFSESVSPNIWGGEAIRVIL